MSGEPSSDQRPIIIGYDMGDALGFKSARHDLHEAIPIALSTPQRLYGHCGAIYATQHAPKHPNYPTAYAIARANNGSQEDQAAAYLHYKDGQIA